MHGETLALPSYTAYTREHLLAVFQQAEQRMRAAIAGLTEDQLRARVRAPDKWSIHEIVMHVTDSEIQGVYRIRKCVGEPDSVFPIYDQDAWVASRNYRQGPVQDREDALILLGALRRSAMQIFRDATAADWDARGKHPEFGWMTLQSLLELYADHVERHIDQILHTRELLGAPIPLTRPLAIRMF